MDKARAWREHALKTSPIEDLEQQIADLPLKKVATVEAFSPYVAAVTRLLPTLLQHYGSRRHRMWAKEVSKNVRACSRWSMIFGCHAKCKTLSSSCKGRRIVVMSHPMQHMFKPFTIVAKTACQPSGLERGSHCLGMP